MFTRIESVLRKGLRNLFTLFLVCSQYARDVRVSSLQSSKVINLRGGWRVGELRKFKSFEITE